MDGTCCSTPTAVPAPAAGRVPPVGMVLPPRQLTNGIELSIHTCTRSMVREVRYIFPHLKIKKQQQPEEPQPQDDNPEEHDEVLIVPTIQKSRIDTVRFGAEVEEEKDRCLEFFADFARPLCEALRAQGHWADYIDPCSGLPVLTPDCTRPYSEVAGFEHLLRYKTQNAGCCKILMHPRWGSSCYPATIFTTAPVGVLQAAIQRQDGKQDSSMLPSAAAAMLA